MHPRRLIALGQVLVGISLLLGMAFMGFLVAQRQAGELTVGGFWVGVFLMALVVSPLLGVGARGDRNEGGRAYGAAALGRYPSAARLH
jgi:hypothetical protein